MGYSLSGVSTLTNPNFSCKGINTVFQTPTGIKVQLQFHTPESFDLKQEPLHKRYEESRLPSTSNECREELKNLIPELSSKVQSPNGIEKIKEGGGHDRKAS